MAPVSYTHLDRLVLVVGEIDDFPMHQRQMAQALAHDGDPVLLLDGDLGIVGRIRNGGSLIVVELVVLAPAQRGERLEPGDRQDPGRHPAVALELVGVAPHVEEHFADQVFGVRLVTDQAEQEPVGLHVVPGVQHLHRQLVACGDAFEQIRVVALFRGDRRIVAECLWLSETVPLNGVCDRPDREFMT